MCSSDLEVVQIAALHLLDEAEYWWFGYLEHAKVTKYSDFFHKLRKNFDVRKIEMCHKETFPKETKEDFNLVTLDKNSLHSPPTAKVLASREDTLATFQDSLELLTHRVPCMIQEMHEEEEVDSSAGTLRKVHPSLLPVFGDTIVWIGGTLVVPTHHWIQGMHTSSPHIASVDLIETYEDMPSGPMHNQGLEHKDRKSVV